MFIDRVVKALETQKVEYALAGGYAVALHGAVRGTVDIDIVLAFKQDQFERAEKAFLSLGLKPRLPVQAKEVFSFREEYISKRNLVAWSFYHPKNLTEIVDVIITQDLKKLKTKNIGKYRVVTISDLIRMKKASGRPQDLADIEALEKL